MQTTPASAEDKHNILFSGWGRRVQGIGQTGRCDGVLPWKPGCLPLNLLSPSPAPRNKTEALLQDALLVLGRELAIVRMREPREVALTRLRGPVSPSAIEENEDYWQSEEGICLTDSLQTRQNKETDSKFLAWRALRQAENHAWIRANPVLAELDWATDAQVKASIDECDALERCEGEKNELRWRYQDNGNVAVLIFGQVAWLCRAGEAGELACIVKCNVAQEKLAYLNHETGAIVPITSKGVATGK